MTKKHILIRMLLAVVMLPTAGAFAYEPSTDPDEFFYDFPAMVEGATASMRDYLKANPDGVLDSIRHHVLDNITDGPVGRGSDLQKASRKKLSSQEVYKKGRRSSLIFGRFVHKDEIKSDTAYKTASAVVLTRDGICATNYHVISDILLTGIFGKDNSNDKGRFLMDCDGNVFPLTAVLATDPVNDWAIIRIDPRGHRLTPATIGALPEIGATVYCLASPSHGNFNFTQGIVSNRTRATDKRNGSTRYNLEITADYGVGASGGPILDEYGNLVGLVSCTISIYADPQNMRNFQMAYKQTVPISLVTGRFAD